MPDNNQFRTILDGFVDGSAYKKPLPPTAMETVSNAPHLPPLRAAVNDSLTGHPIPVPPNVSIPQDMSQTGSRFLNIPWFYGMVHHGAPWDFLTRMGPKYENFGNVHYGATGTALGLPQWLLDRAAGAYQVLRGTSQPGWSNPLGPPPYGDDPKDQWYINQGIAYARRPST